MDIMTENRLLNSVFAIKDNKLDLLMIVDYPNLSNETDDKEAELVCVDFENTYMVDNTVDEHNTHRIKLKDLLSNSERYTVYRLQEFNLNEYINKEYLQEVK